jgi:hypothetical protein
MTSTVSRPANPSITNTPSWIVGVLNGIGAPLTSQNVQALKLWAGAEGTSARNNPLATTLGSPQSGVTIAGSTQFNQVGVQNYPNESTGVAATVQTLKQYPQITTALRNSANTETTVAAINSSPWGSHIGPGTNPSNGAGASGNSSTTSGSSCDGSPGIKTPGIFGSVGSFTILSGCQLKALKGGLFVVAGGLIMIVGVVLIVGKGSKVGKTLVGLTPVGRAVQAVPSGNPSRAGSATLSGQESSRQRDFREAQEEGSRNAREAGPFPEAA